MRGFAKWVLFVACVLGCRHTEEADVKGQAATPHDDQPKNVATGIGDIFRYNYGPRNQGSPVPAVRAAFRRTLGCAKAQVTVVDSLDPKYQQGIFDPKATGKTSYDAWVRFSMDRTVPTGEDDFDKASLAFSMKVLPDRAGEKPPVAAIQGEQDFITQNHPVFFADTASEFLLAFVNPQLLNPETVKVLEKQFGTAFGNGIPAPAQARMDKILDQMAKSVGNSLRKTFWSVTPYQFGNTYAKYRIVPVLCGSTVPSTVVDKTRALYTLPGTLGKVFDDVYGDEELPKNTSDKTYLAERLARDLGHESACFEFQVQLHDDQAEDKTETPLDHASMAWDETKYPPQTVAKITLAPQDPSKVAEACNMARFSPGNAHPDHAPVGSINLARVMIYDRFATCRSQQNAGQDGNDAFRKSCLPNGSK